MIRSPGTSARCSASQNIVSPAPRIGNDSTPWAGGFGPARWRPHSGRRACRGFADESWIVVKIAHRKAARRGSRGRAVEAARRPRRRGRAGRSAPWPLPSARARIRPGAASRRRCRGGRPAATRDAAAVHRQSPIRSGRARSRAARLVELATTSCRHATGPNPPRRRSRQARLPAELFTLKHVTSNGVIFCVMESTSSQSAARDGRGAVNGAGDSGRTRFSAWS